MDEFDCSLSIHSHFLSGRYFAQSEGTLEQRAAPLDPLGKRVLSPPRA